MVPNPATPQAWVKPEFVELEAVIRAKGDPTISDDGLGDGLSGP